MSSNSNIDVRVLPLGPLQANCTVLSESSRAVVIDPGGDLPTLRALLDQSSLKLEGIILTHGHIDHVAGAEPLRAAYPDSAAIYLHPADAELYAQASRQAMMFGLPEVRVAESTHELANEQILSFGSISMRVIHTPGHSPGSVSLYLEHSKLLICGDVLFAGSIGRTDLWGGSFETLMASINDHLLPLGDDVRVITGHGPDTDLGTEKRSNPFVRGTY